MLLPESLQRRLTDQLSEFRFRGVQRFALIISSLLLGIATHILWDSFTHRSTWLYRHWPVLSSPVSLPIVGYIQLYKALQHGSSLIGIALLCAWLLVWYKARNPSAESPPNTLSPVRKLTLAATVVALALLGAIARAFFGMGVPSGRPGLEKFVGVVVVTAIAFTWWQLAVFGLFLSSSAWRRPQASKSHDCASNA